MISSPSSSQVNMPTEPTATPSSFDQYQYQQNYQQPRDQQQSEINRALDETRDNIRKSTDEAKKIFRVILKLLVNIKNQLESDINYPS